MGLNQAQMEAVTHKNGPCMVLAGPGSGKTTVITQRVEYLIQKQGVKPEEILVITFSKAAAKEMKERFHKLHKGAMAPVTFGTFHGIFYGILKWAYRLTADNIFSEEQKYQLIQQIVENLNIDMDDEKDFLQGISSEISAVKNNREEVSRYQAVNCQNHVFVQIYEAYEQERKARRKLDFDDMLVLTYELFQKRPDILKLWQEKFKYILVDEFQDVNQVQYDVVRMLAAPENHLFIVGDDDQSIYQFRGARPEIMLHFPKDYPETKQIVLDVNYRSTKSIVSAAGRLVRRNEKRYEKQIITTNEQGVPVHIQEVKHPTEESKYVIRQIQEARKQGIPAEEIAVLFRTNIEARNLIETCMEYHIPFQMREHIPNLYEHFIAKNLITYMKMALGERSRSAFLSIMNRPNRYFHRDCVEKGQVSFEELRKLYAEKEWMLDRIDQLELDLRILQRMAPYGAIQYIRKHIGYDDFLREYAQARKIKLEDLQDVIHEIEECAKEYKTIEEWFLHIEHYTEELKRQKEYTKNKEDTILLMTMHGAKGLEFHTVFIIGANEGITPYKKAETKDELEEERRMFYVAMTRAKKRLVITYTKEKNGKKIDPSRYIGELLKKEDTNVREKN